MQISLPFLRRKKTTTPSDVDPISLFESEAGLDATLDPSSVRAAVRAIVRGVPPGEISDDHVTVDAIVSRKTHVQWLEAVAIVHGASQQAAEDGIPDSLGIILTANGAIRIERPRRPAGVDDLARTLHVLVAGEQIPAPLRLFIAKWISASDTHTLADFSKELAYFARPDNEALIRAVYERHLKTPSGPLAMAKPVEPPKAIDEKKKAKGKIVVPRWAVVVVVAVVVAGTAAMLVRTLMRPQSETTLADSVVAATTGISLSGERATKTDTELPVPKPARGQRSATSDSSPGRRRTEASINQPAFAPRLPLGAATIDLYGRPSSPSPVRPGQAAVGTAFGDAPSAIPAVSPDRVYTVNDATVKPPLMLYPSLPPVLAVNGDTNTMEVVVSREGLVERVRLISVARRMTDMMLLSGAKTWRFQAASLSGEPVRYRMVVSWSATP